MFALRMSKADDPRSYYQVAKRLHAETNNSIYINQYFNELNTLAHYKTTGPEIWKQTNGEITHLVACSGTGGTISGCARYLKEQNPKYSYYWCRCLRFCLKEIPRNPRTRPQGNLSLPHWRFRENLIPTATDFDVIDQFVKVTDEESAHTARETTKKEGMFVGLHLWSSCAGFKAVASRGWIW